MLADPHDALSGQVGALVERLLRPHVSIRSSPRSVGAEDAKAGLEARPRPRGLPHQIRTRNHRQLSGLPSPRHALQPPQRPHSALNQPTSVQPITLDREPLALRSTRNSSEESSAPRRGLAGRATEQLAGRAGGSLALAGGPPPSRHGFQAPQALSTGARWGSPARAAGGMVAHVRMPAVPSSACGCPRQRPESVSGAGVQHHACLSTRPLSGVRCGRLSVRMSGVQRGCPVSVGSRVHCVRPGGCGGGGGQAAPWLGWPVSAWSPALSTASSSAAGSEPGGRGWRRSAGSAEGSAWTWPSS